MTLPTLEEIAEWRGWQAFNGPARINHHVPEDRTEWDRLLAAALRAIELEEAVREWAIACERIDSLTGATNDVLEDSFRYVNEKALALRRLVEKP